MTLTGNTIHNNTSDSEGGGAAAYWSVITLTANTVSSNTAEGTGGGLCLLDVTGDISNNIVVSNTTANAAGGLALLRGEFTVQANNIMSNTADYGCGGLLIDYSQGTFRNNVLAHNRAGSVGGLCVLDWTDAVFTNTAIIGNQDGGLVAYHASARMLHTTIANNVGGYGFGMATLDGALSMTNTILAGHTMGITATAGSTITLDGVLWFGNAANRAGPGAITITRAYTGDPAFAPDGYHLTAGSAAINRGVQAGVADDIDGQPRSVVPDLGADEYPLDESIYLPAILGGQ